MDYVCIVTGHSCMRKRSRADGGANVGSVDISGGGCEFISVFPRVRVAVAN